MNIRKTVDFNIDFFDLASAFATAGSEEQAQFLIEVADLAAAWEHAPDMQWHYIAIAINELACATERTRVKDMLVNIASRIE